jgi:hypothetical protein
MKPDPARSPSCISVGNISALEQICRLRGGSQPHLMRCSDGYMYVVKFKNNSQSVRILINELIAFRLASELGLPLPYAAVVNVSPALIRYTRALTVEWPDGWIACVGGKQFGSQYVGNPRQPRAYTDPDPELATASNRSDAWGVLVFDLWTDNQDRRQFVTSENQSNGCRLYMIDNGFCLGGRNWAFPDKLRRNKCPVPGLYQGISGISSFEQWLTKLEDRRMSDVVKSVIDFVPHEWYSDSAKALREVLAALNERRFIVRSRLSALRDRYPDVFPNWVSAIGPVKSGLDRLPPQSSHPSGLFPSAEGATHNTL